MKTVLDVEAVVQWLDTGKVDGSPFNPLNELVSVGYRSFDYDEIDKQELDCGSAYWFFHHNDGIPSDHEFAKEELQTVLNETTLLIGHNIKFDLMWLWASGFKYEGHCYDTMACEYILARGIRTQLSLDASCIRRNTSLKKGSLVKDYWDRKIGYEAMPRNIVEEYGRQDVQSTYELYLKQMELMKLPRNIGLQATLDMHNEMLVFLAEVETNGIYINLNALRVIERDYIDERERLKEDINRIVADVMGDTPINLASSEHLSMVLYSRRVLDKREWKTLFNLGKDEQGKDLRRPKLSNSQLVKAIKNGTRVIYRTSANHCHSCNGTGRVDKYKKDGLLYKIPPKCAGCDGNGILYVANGRVAGLKLAPRNIKDVSANGFTTDKEILEYFAALPSTSLQAKELLKKLIRLSAVETYLASFVNGIRRNVRLNKLLHTTFNQCITATARLSSQDPNFQNIPRGTTFPVKRCVRSRFKGGSILEADSMQLEFRTAAGLSGCPVMLSEIVSGADIHSFTAKVLTEAGEPTNRQDAKKSTFKPLYGGQSGTPAQVAYVKYFMNKYTGLREWQEKLLDIACSKHMITNPSGRQLMFPDAARNFYGYVSGQTKIVNYPVQSFATGDYMPIVCIRLRKLFKKNAVKSLIINTVHDSVVIDIFPTELDNIVALVKEAFLGAHQELLDRYNYNFKVPLGVEIKNGRNWLSGSEIAKLDQVKEWMKN